MVVELYINNIKDDIINIYNNFKKYNLLNIEIYEEIDDDIRDICCKAYGAAIFFLHDNNPTLSFNIIKLLKNRIEEPIIEYNEKIRKGCSYRNEEYYKNQLVEDIKNNIKYIMCDIIKIIIYI